MHAPRAGIVLPARLGSTRLPRKVLADLGGVPLVVASWRNARRAPGFATVLVATDSEEVAAACAAHGVPAVMTAAAHGSGTERVAEVAASAAGRDLELLINVQADEPFVAPEDLAALARALAGDAAAQLATLRHPLADPADLANPNVVKVVCAADGAALYFSRAPIPYDRDAPGACGGAYRHVGVYAYRRDFLLRLAATPPCALERIERLEQLRALHLGARLLVVDGRSVGLGIDTPADLERARALVRQSG